MAGSRAQTAPQLRTDPRDQDPIKATHESDAAAQKQPKKKTHTHTQQNSHPHKASYYSRHSGLSIQCRNGMRASTVASKWPIFPTARFLLVSAAVNEEPGGSGRPGVRAAAKLEERSHER